MATCTLPGSSTPLYMEPYISSLTQLLSEMASDRSDVGVGEPNRTKHLLHLEELLDCIDCYPCSPVLVGKECEYYQRREY